MKNSTGSTHGDGTTSDSLDITESELNDILSRVNDCIARHNYTFLCREKDDKPKNLNFLNNNDIHESQMLEIIKDLKWENFCPPPVTAYDRRFKRSLLYVFKIEKLLSYKKSQYSDDENPTSLFDEGRPVANYKNHSDSFGLSDSLNANNDSFDGICEKRLINIYIKLCLVKYDDVENLIVVSFHESTSINSNKD